MLKFAGVPLSLADPEGRVQAWIDRYKPELVPVHGPASLVEGRDRPQGNTPHRIGLPRFNWQQLPPRWRLNSLWWPTGASRFAVGLFMTTLKGANRIKSAIGSSSQGTLEIGDGKRTLSVKMRLLQPVPVGAVAADNPVVLLPLVDSRYVWQWSKMASIPINPSGTWSSLADKIIENLGAAIGRPSPVGYDGPDWSEWSRSFENAALALDAYCASVGQRFVASYEPLYECRKATEDTTTAKAQLAEFKERFTAGGELLDMGMKVPEKLTVVFPRRQGGVPSGTGACHTVTKNASDYGFAKQQGGEAVIHSTMQADFSQRTSNPDNGSTLNDLAGAIARDYYGWRKYRYSATIPGIADDWKLTGFDDYVWFLCGTPVASAGDCGCESDDEGLFAFTEMERRGQSPPLTCLTLVESLGPNFGFEEQTSQELPTAAPRTFRPVGLVRGELTTPVTAGVATGRLLYDYVGTGTLVTDGHDVQLFDTMGLQDPLTPFEVGDKFWLSALAGDTDMFELVAGKLKAKMQVVVFELLATLAMSGEANARICTLSGGNYVANGASIVVVDPWDDPGAWHGVAGYRGLAALRSDGKYDVVWMERQALIVRWVATGNRNIANEWWPAAEDPAPHETFQHGPQGAAIGARIYDPRVIYPKVITGAKGLAIYDDRNDRWEAINAQQQCRKASATLVNQLDEDSPDDVDISSFTVQDFSPFNMAPSPLPTQARNLYKYAGQLGAIVELEWFHQLGVWVIVNVIHRFRKVPFNIRIKADKTFIEWEEVQCAMAFGKTQAYVDKIALKKCN